MYVIKSRPLFLSGYVDFSLPCMCSNKPVVPKRWPEFPPKVLHGAFY